VSCVNALSEELNLEIWRDGFTWETDLLKRRTGRQAEENGRDEEPWTRVHFVPDKTIFTATEYNYDTLAQRLRELAFLNKAC